MKKMLIEYANLIAYTVTGLVFGLSFFLLFINFYHAKELSENVNIKESITTNQVQVTEKINMIKTNSASFDQSANQSRNDFYDMSGIQLKLNRCIQIYESEESKSFLAKEKITLKDAYDFNRFYQNSILNDCLIMEISPLGTDSIYTSIPSLTTIKPFIRTSIENMSTGLAYVGNNLKNADTYFYSTDTNRNTIFNLTKDSYYDSMNRYQKTLDLLVNLSNWYKSTVVGG